MAQTLKQAIKAVAAYAKKHNRVYINVRQNFVSDYRNPETGRLTFSAYIDGFGIWPDGETIEEIIAQFDKALPIPIAPPANVDDLIF